MGSGSGGVTEVLIFHALWACSAVLVLIPPDALKTLAPEVKGQRIFYSLLFYNFGLAITCKLFKKHQEFDIWLFCFLTSIMQVLPDWFLAAQLKTLVFPDKTFPKIGAVSAYMALAWSPVFFMTIFFTRLITRNQKLAYIVAGLISSLILFVAEADPVDLNMWKATHIKHTLFHKNIAAYVLLPETLLGVVAYAVYNWTSATKPGFDNLMAKLFGGLFVMLSYTGALALSFFFIESHGRAYLPFK